jgi:hypothetical protein
MYAGTNNSKESGTNIETMKLMTNKKSITTFNMTCDMPSELMSEGGPAADQSPI